MATLQKGERYRITYTNGQGKRSERVIHVRTVSQGAYGRSYVRAFCELAGEERTFRQDRMEEVEHIDATSSETSVTRMRNSSYAATAANPGARAVATPMRAPTPTANGRVVESRRSGGLGRLLLRAAALFVLFDFVIAEDPGRMSGNMAEMMASIVHSQLSRSDHDTPPRPTPRPVNTTEGEFLGTLNIPASRVETAQRLDLLRERAPSDPRESPKAIRMERLARESGVTDELVISRYDRADLDGDDELSWTELKLFQKQVYRDFRYESNDTALRPREFFVAGGGDCEDFAIFSAAMLTYWGWEAYVASMGTNDYDAHAVVFIRVDDPPYWASYYEIDASPGDPRFAASGRFVPVDYDVVGGISSAVSPGSRVTDVVVPREWYGLRI